MHTCAICRGAAVREFRHGAAHGWGLRPFLPKRPSGAQLHEHAVDERRPHVAFRQQLPRNRSRPRTRGPPGRRRPQQPGRSPPSRRPHRGARPRGRPRNPNAISRGLRKSVRGGRRVNDLARGSGAGSAVCRSAPYWWRGSPSGAGASATHTSPRDGHASVHRRGLGDMPDGRPICKYVIDSFRSAPDAPRYVTFSRDLASATSSSSRTSGSRSRGSRTARAATASADPISPSAHAACLLTSGSLSPSAATNTGTDSSAPPVWRRRGAPGPERWRNGRGTPRGYPAVAIRRCRARAASEPFRPTRERPA
jgi:hypothetical protein